MIRQTGAASLEGRANAGTSSMRNQQRLLAWGKAAGRPVGSSEAALDGSIEELVDWRPVKAGEFYYVPAGTIHAIGAGISLLEFQQNADVTYRLYDYGRPRELHLDDGIAVSRTMSPTQPTAGGRPEARWTPFF